MMAEDLDLRPASVPSWVDMVPPHTIGPSYPADPMCDEPSPTGVMLCILPTSRGLPHYFQQHLGLDRHGNFRGWPDTRKTVL